MLSEKLKRLRKSKNLTQKDISDIFNVSLGAVGNWETGTRNPDIDKLIAIADYFGVSVDYLVGREELPADPVPEPVVTAESLPITEAEQSAINSLPKEAVETMVRIANLPNGQEYLDMLIRKAEEMLKEEEAHRERMNKILK